MGQVEHIHIASRKGAPVQAVDSISVVKHVGVIGDRHALKAGEWDESHVGEELTLVAGEEIDALARDHGIHLQPGETRRNVTTRGVDVNDLLGKRFSVGEVVAEGVELCEPCTHLQSVIGKPIIKPLVHRAGLRALLVNGGTIRLGDAVEVLGPAEMVEAKAPDFA